MTKAFYLTSRGAEFKGFGRVNIYLNYSMHKLLVIPAVYGCVGHGTFTFDVPSERDILKTNHLDMSKHEYAFIGHHKHNGYIFNLLAPNVVKDVVSQHV